MEPLTKTQPIAQHAAGRHSKPKTKPEYTTFEIIHCEWDHNGSHRVTVRMNRATHTAKDVRRARDIARAGVSRPDKVQWTRLDNTYLPNNGDEYDYYTHFRFTVSRLDRSHR